MPALNVLLIDMPNNFIKLFSNITIPKVDLIIAKYKKNCSFVPDIVFFPDSAFDKANNFRFLYKKDIQYVCLAEKERQKDLVKEDWIIDIWDVDIDESLFEYKINNFSKILAQWNIYKRDQMYLDAVINLSPNMVWFKDLQGRHMLVNNVFKKYCQKSAEEIIGKEHEDIWGKVTETASQTCMDSDVVITTTGISKTFDEKLVINKSVKDLLTYKAPLRDEFGSIVGTVGIGRDVTIEKIKEQQLHYNATHDGLTGILTRQAFNSEISNNNTDHFAIMFFDLDDFKKMNDKYGHDLGDKVIKMFASILQEVFPSDIIGRYGGDEFVVYTCNPQISELYFKNKILLLEDYINNAKKTDARFESLGTSIGISFGKKGKTVAKTVSFADIAMYRAKQLHKAKNIKEDFGQKGSVYYVIN